MYDLNDAEPQRSGELIPDGTFAKVAMVIRPGGMDGQTEIDRGLLKASNTPGSDVLNLDCEFTVLEGPHAKRKFWQNLVASGGKVDEAGVSIGWKITKSTVRAMIDSALGLNPEDMGEDAKRKRILRGLADLSGIAFVAKIKIEPGSDDRYGDANRLERVVLPSEEEWRKVMNGEDVPPKPSHRGRRRAPANTPAPQPAWSHGAPQGPQGGQEPAWRTQQPAPAAASPAQPQPQPASPGPAWLNG